MPTTTYTPGQKVHKFELAGLGTAPYAYLGCEHKVFVAYPGAPEQPGGCCDYCGTGISYQFHLRSADGKKFKVGSDCILKVDSSTALRVAVETELQTRQREQREARAAVKRQKDGERIATAKANLLLVAEIFRAQPHPYSVVTSTAPYGPTGNASFFADKTRLDWAEWMLTNAGTSGRLTVAKAIEAALEAK